MESQDNIPPTVLFDGVCNLCSGSVQFILRHETRPALKFAALQSDWAKDALRHYADCATYLGSVVLLEQGECFVRSDAVVRLARYLRWPWSMVRWIELAPKSARDAVYDWIVKHRYRWFGKREVCWVANGDIRHRFWES